MYKNPEKKNEIRKTRHRGEHLREYRVFGVNAFA